MTKPLSPAELAAIKAVWLPPTNLHWNPTSRVQAGRAATDIAALLGEVERLRGAIVAWRDARIARPFEWPEDDVLRSIADETNKEESHQY